MGNNLRPLSSRFISSTFSLGSLSVVSIVLGLATNMVIARQFSANIFGTFILVHLVASFLGQISSLGLDISIAKFISGTENEDRKQALVSTALSLRLLAIVVICIAAWFGRFLILRFLKASELNDLILFIPLLLFSDSTRNSFISILQGFFRFSQIGIANLLASLLYLILILTITSFSNFGIVGLILAKVLANFISGIYAYLSIPINKKLSFRREIVNEVVRFGFPLHLNDILHFIHTRIDTIIIGLYLGPVDIAIYEFARKIPDSLRQLYEPFRSVYFSFSSRLFDINGEDKAAKLLNNSTRLVAFGSFFSTAFVLLFGKGIVELVFSEKYIQSYPIFVILMINLSLCLIGNVLGTSLVAVGESDKPVIVNIFNTIGSVIGVVLFTPVWGIGGAAIGITFGTITVFPPTMIFLWKKIDAKVISFLKPLAIFCAWGAIILLLNPTTILAKSFFLFIFLSSCFLLSVITKNDIRILLVGFGVTSWKVFRKFFRSSVEL